MVCKAHISTNVKTNTATATPFDYYNLYIWKSDENMAINMMIYDWQGAMFDNEKKLSEKVNSLP